MNADASGVSSELEVFNSVKIKKGLCLFILLTIAALTAIFLYTDSGDTLDAFKHLESRYFLLVLGLSFLDMALGALRNHIYFMVVAKEVTFWTSIRANLANIFMGAVTPSQSGGGPAQLYIYYNAGVSMGKAISVGVLNLLATIVFFVVSAGFSIFILSDSFSSLMRSILFFCFVIFVIQLVIYFLAVWKPESALKIIRKLSMKLASILPRFEKRITGFTEKIVMELTAYKETCSVFLKKNIYIPVLALFLTFVLYINKFIMAYFIMVGLGASGDFLTVISIQALVLFISYYSLSPGASGIAEISIAALMASVISKDSLVIFAVLQRFFILYLPVIFGSIVVFKEAGSALKNKQPAT